jgi:pilus assembly protein CpaE
VTVFSTKGGSGKTVIATNLAVCFARQAKRTLLIDFDLHSGDDALVLGLSPRWTILDLVQSPGDLDAEKLAGFVTRHSSGVDLLPAPTRPDEEELVSIERLEPLIEIARQSYDVVVIDTSSLFSPATLLAIDHTDTLLLVGASDVPTIKSLKIALETLELLEMRVKDVRIVMNRSGAKVGLEDRDVERTLRRQITYTISSDKAIPVSVNRGQPVVVDAPKSRVSRSLQDMALGLVTKARSAR